MKAYILMTKGGVRDFPVAVYLDKKRANKAARKLQTNHGYQYWVVKRKIKGEQLPVLEG